MTGRALRRAATFYYLFPGGAEALVPTALSWSRECPFAVTVTFYNRHGAPTAWTIGRDLLAAGLRGPAGAGDVQLLPSLTHRGSVELILDGPDGLAGLRCPRGVLQRFLGATYRAVPAGAEVLPESWFERLVSS